MRQCFKLIEIKFWKTNRMHAELGRSLGILLSGFIFLAVLSFYTMFFNDAPQSVELRHTCALRMELMDMSSQENINSVL